MEYGKRPNVDQEPEIEVEKEIRHASGLTLVPLSKIKISPDRQRKDEEESSSLEFLIESIDEHGLLHPVILHDDFTLMTGFRRLSAWTEMEKRGYNPGPLPCLFLSTLERKERFEIEFIENSQRKALQWKDEAEAVLQYHSMRQGDEGEYEPKEWTVQDTANKLNLSHKHTERCLAVAREMREGNAQVLASDSIRAAYGLVNRDFKRRMENELMSFSTSDRKFPLSAPGKGANRPEGLLERSPDMEIESEEIQLRYKLEQRSLLEATSVEPLPNLVHCDFPYGAMLHKSDQFNTARYDTQFQDEEDDYKELLEHLISNFSGFAGPSCHLLFWFPMKFYFTTVRLLSEANWRVNPYPLVWHKSDNVGIVPDVVRGPRRVYETALLASIGDRKIIKPIPNCVSAPTRKAEAKHVSEKPLSVVKFFLTMLVDDTTVIFDPTCGSGTALAASLMLGARFATGWDINPASIQASEENLRKATIHSGFKEPEIDAEISLDGLDL